MITKDEMKDYERYKEFAARFRQALISKGWDSDNVTREEAGKLLGGVSGPTVSMWYHGERMPTPKKAAMICEAMNISMDWLMNGTGTMEAAPSERNCLDMYGLSDEDIAIIKALVSKLRPDDECQKCAIDAQGRRKEVRRLLDRRETEGACIFPDGAKDRRKK